MTTTTRREDDHDEKEDNDNEDKGVDVCMAPIVREEECVLVLLSFIWIPLDNTLFIAPDMGY